MALAVVLVVHHDARQRPGAVGHEQERSDDLVLTIAVLDQPLPVAIPLAFTHNRLGRRLRRARPREQHAQSPPQAFGRTLPIDVRAGRMHGRDTTCRLRGETRHN